MSALQTWLQNHNRRMNQDAIDEALMEYISLIEKQRDELLAALERFMDSHEECTDFGGFTARIVSMGDYHKLMEAVARAKGEQ